MLSLIKESISGKKEKLPFSVTLGSRLFVLDKKLTLIIILGSRYWSVDIYMYV